ncbi:hypothetical protein Aduo_002785 [Ancylostoma duodenale]
MKSLIFFLIALVGSEARDLKHLNHCDVCTFSITSLGALPRMGNEFRGEELAEGVCAFLDSETDDDSLGDVCRKVSNEVLSDSTLRSRAEGFVKDKKSMLDAMYMCKHDLSEKWCDIPDDVLKRARASV